VHLERWVCDGIEPPPSALPRRSDSTAVPRAQVVEAFRALSAVSPDPGRLASLPRLDFGSDGDNEAGLPPTIGEPYPALVSAVDADGNEVAGVRLPDVTVPLATLMGWNPRHAQTGGAGQIMPLTGSTLPFARTEAERGASRDPRPSVEQRYRDRADYLERVRQQAGRLAEQRYLLAEDVEVVTANAAALWDALIGSPTPATPPTPPKN